MISQMGFCLLDWPSFAGWTSTSDASGFSPYSRRSPLIQSQASSRLVISIIFLKTEQFRKSKASAQYPLRNLKTLGVCAPKTAPPNFLIRWWRNETPANPTNACEPVPAANPTLNLWWGGRLRFHNAARCLSYTEGSWCRALIRTTMLA